MSFIIDKEEIKPGLIIFRRGDVDHRNYYCRIKLPKADRYKTVSLKTAILEEARNKAFDVDADVRFRIKHDAPIFIRISRKQRTFSFCHHINLLSGYWEYPYTCRGETVR